MYILKNIKFLLILIILSLSFLYLDSIIFSKNLYAQIIINEIMYDPEGTDTGREWVEVYNNSDKVLDFTAYKLLESSINHKISEFSGGKHIPAMSFAIIADNPSKFIIDHPNLVGGLIFDSAFSLNNTGEEISITDSSGNQIDKIFYKSELGAVGDGNSLQIFEGVLVASKATPNLANKNDPILKEVEDNIDIPDEDGSQVELQDVSSHSGQNDLSIFKPKINYEIDIGRDRFTLINTPIEFEIIHNQEKKSGHKTLWSFGDGNSINGKKVKHYFDRKGEYNVVLNSAYKKNYATDRLKVTVLEPNIEFSSIKSGKGVDLMLKNNTGHEINIGDFSIKTADDIYVFPKDTLISNNQVLLLSQKTTKLNYLQFIDLYYPNGNYFTGFIVPN